MPDQQTIVAVVDDDPEMRVAMATLLGSLGYSVETFDSAETFLVVAAVSRVSCLLVDIQLGDISGIELAHQLAAEGLKYPIVFMTGLDDAVAERQAAAADGIAFLRKPFPANNLFDAIKKAVG